jgi:ABC-2 type transport system ATP-binding protein
VIQANGLTKRYGSTLAVDHLSFEVRPGLVTGFLGPNGSGKSTTMRMILGLDRPETGAVKVGGRAYRNLPWPLREVGALLEAKSVHPGRTAYNHLLALAATNAIPRRRIAEMLDLVGLSEVSNKRVGTFSLGMGQRLGIAAALLGDPGIILFDEPVNGLDPEGIRWVRNLLKGLAAEGRTVFVSSHLMNEMAVTADHVVVIGKGRLIAEAPIADFVARSANRTVRVRSPRANELAELLRAGGAVIANAEDGTFDVAGIEAPAIGDLAAERGIALHELTPQAGSLEDAFMELTQESVEFRGGGNR